MSGVAGAKRRRRRTAADQVSGREARMGGCAVWSVYIIRSISSRNEEYTGATADLRQRLSDHNAGKSAHTSKFLPWELVWYCAFPDKHRALEFERYLKSHSSAPRKISGDGKPARLASDRDTPAAPQPVHPEPWASRGFMAAPEVVEAAAHRYPLHGGDGAEGRGRPVRLDLPRGRSGIVERR